MADLIGMNAEAWLARATIAQYTGTPKGERIARVLGKALLATGAVLGTSGASASEAVSYLIRCIERLSYKPTAHPAF